MTRKNFLAAFAAALQQGHAADGARQFQLKNDFFDLLVVAGPAGVWIQRLALNQESGAFTGNLCSSSATSGWLRSGTAILTEGLPWQFSRTAATANAKATATSLRIDDVLIGPDTDPLAREVWEIELAGKRLSWRIERKFLREIRVVSDRFPAFVFRTRGEDGSGRKGFIEIPGFLDPDMRLDGTRGFDLHVPKEEWREAVSPNRVQEIHLAPSGIVLASRMDTGLFSYAKQPADGTAAVVAIGANSAGPSPATRQKWELSFNAGNTSVFSDKVQKWIKGNLSKYKFRYIGALAGDFHRLLSNGGLFMYPAILNHSDPKENRPQGKLRLLYEANVVAFMCREAGGDAIDENGTPILDIKPAKHHQRTTLYVGSKPLIDALAKLLKG